jgi:hypothetical protein
LRFGAETQFGAITMSIRSLPADYRAGATPS